MNIPTLFTARIGILSLVVLGGCRPAVDVDAGKTELLDTDREFAQYSVDHSAAEAFKKYLVEDALQLPHGAEPVMGRENISQGLASAEGLELHWQPEDGEVSKSADMGWTWGRYQAMVPGPDGETITSHGKYLNVWRKQADGSWRVRVDMGNQNPPPAITPP